MKRITAWFRRRDNRELRRRIRRYGYHDTRVSVDRPRPL